MMIDNIPDELKKLDRWVGVEKGSKVPMQLYWPFNASSVAPATWGEFKRAKLMISKGVYQNPGFVFDENDGYVGVDIDSAFTAEGWLSSDAFEILKKCQSYTELSVSGRGFHIIMKGTLPFKGRNNLEGLEMYKAERYFVMTGNVVTYKDIVENQEAIDWLVDTYMKDIELPKTTSSGTFGNRLYSPVWSPLTKGSKTLKLSPTYPRIGQGGRNMALLSLAGQLLSTGYSIEQIHDELLKVNRTACDPPLDESEVDSIVLSISKYERRDD